ncbi:MAG: nuclear transport factor 2 family protein [Burkholderiales bacterium]|nr:nuclear transport factor 2 family protein [Burkholderiales bacterium]
MSDPRARKVAQAALMASADDTEATFYDALQQADLDRLMSVWSDDDEIACVHPGGARVVGRGAIRSTFEAIFANGPVQVTLQQVRRLESGGCAVHHVMERVQAMSPEGLQTAFVLATNVYLRTAQGWRMVLHHASLGRQHELQEVTEPTATLH